MRLRYPCKAADRILSETGLLDNIGGDVSNIVNRHEMVGPENLEWGILIFDSQELESFTKSFPGDDFKLRVYHAPLRTSHVSDPSVTHEDRRASRRECSHTNKGTGEVGKLIFPLLQLLLLSLTHRLDQAWVCLWSSWHPASIVYLAYDSSAPKVNLHTAWINRQRGS